MLVRTSIRGLAKAAEIGRKVRDKELVHQLDDEDVIQGKELIMRGQLLTLPRLEVTSPLDFLRTEQVAQTLVAPGENQLREWQSGAVEAVLGAVRHFRRNPRRCRFAQHPLVVEACLAACVRDRSQHFEQFVIEEGHPNLDAVGHAHAIFESQQAARE